MAPARSGLGVVSTEDALSGTRSRFGDGNELAARRSVYPAWGGAHMDGWLQLGKQRICRSGDLVDLEIAGEITPTELLSGFAMGQEVQQQYGYALFLITIAGPWSFPPNTRQALAKFHRENKAVGATAVVGASSTMRMLIDLVLRAIARLVGQAPTTRFFATRADALAWLDERRLQGLRGRLTR